MKQNIKLEARFGRINCTHEDDHGCIEFYDVASGTQFLEVKLTKEQCYDMILGNRTAKVTGIVRNLSNVGKTRVRDVIEIELESDLSYKDRAKQLTVLAEDYIDKTFGVDSDWVPSVYINQNTFFKMDGKSYARCDVYRFVDTLDE